jgi:hypothetical protein
MGAVEIIYDESDVVDGGLPKAEDANVQVHTYFPTSIYTVEVPEYLELVKSVAIEAVSEDAKDYDEIFPVVMSTNLSLDPRLDGFANYVGKIALDILDLQGVATENYHTYFTEMWMQEHHKHSLMEQHSHAGGTQVIGFYFLDVPEKASPLIVHDPRPGKVQIGLFQKSQTDITYSSDTIVIQPKPGMMVFTNAWLPHSFGRHGSDEPIRFIHFNLATVPRMNPNQEPMACPSS